MPEISVILPVRNGVKTIARGIASIRQQTFTDWELIVADDGSTDGTAAVVRELAREDGRVRLLSLPPAGIVGALNASLDVAQGTLIARMDADDVSHPERLAEQRAFLRQPEQADIGLVSCLVAFGGDRGAAEGYALHVDWINALRTPAEIALNRFVESPLAHPSVMFRRELVSRWGGYRAGEFPEDYELWLRWLDAGVRMAKVPRVLLEWEDSPARASRTDPRYAPEAFFRVKAAWIARELRRMAGEREVWVWGAGRPTRRRAAELAHAGVRIAGYIDVDPKKATAALGGTGCPVIVPASVPPPGSRVVLGYVGTRGARAFIRADLERRDYVEGRDFLMCA